MGVQTEREHGTRPPLEGPASLVDSVAWWMLTGVGQPGLEDLIVYGSRESIQQRQEVADQVQRLLDAAEVAGIRSTLEAVLSDLVQKQPLP